MDALAILKEVSERDRVNGRIVEALDDAGRLIGGDIDRLEKRLIEVCDDAPGKLSDTCRHIIEAGGKRIRPMLCLLVYRAAGGADPCPVDLAVVSELLHNATLLHDDVIDEGEVRRGKPAARVVYGNAISVLGGDYLLVKTVEMVSKRGPDFVDFYVQTMHNLVGGELAQLRLRGSVDTTEEDYFRVIEGKTASLFRWAAYTGALAAEKDKSVSEQLGLFGWHVGVAFQIMDDVLDFTADPSQLGKTLLADIGEGKMTLPVILAGQVSPDVKALLDRLRRGEDPAEIASLMADLVSSTGAVVAVKKCAREHTDLALQALGTMDGLENESVRVLEGISRGLLDRES
jgi:octaprenyl-diphosphate synthase